MRLARLAAVCLLVLVACPFTAPFATCALNDAIVPIAFDDDGGDSVAKILADTALPVFATAPALAAGVPANITHDADGSLCSTPPSFPLPLRV
jgi:hypothetical protein